MTEGRLFVISAPSGAGKTSLVRALPDRIPDVTLSISHTTRTRRDGERDGIDYHFVSAREFAAMRDRGAFLEHAEVFGNHYGTAFSSVADQRATGHDVMLEIDWQGARIVRSKIAEAISIFVLPPSLETLEQRLRLRDTDTPEIIARRLAQARDDILHCGEFDLCLVNDDFGEALDTLEAMVRDPDGYQDPDDRPCTERILGLSS